MSEFSDWTGHTTYLLHAYTCGEWPRELGSIHQPHICDDDDCPGNQIRKRLEAAEKAISWGDYWLEELGRMPLVLGATEGAYSDAVSEWRGFKTQWLELKGEADGGE